MEYIDDAISQQYLSIALVRSNTNQRIITAAVYNRIIKPSVTTSNTNEETNTDNINHMRMTIFEFIDNDQFSSLDSFLNSQISSSSASGNMMILYISEDFNDRSKGDFKKVYNIISNKELNLNHLKNTMFLKKNETMSSIVRLTKITTHTINTLETEMPHVLGCVECLLQVLKLLEVSNDISFELCYGSLHTFMRLDSAAADAINLLPKPDHPSQYGSLFGVLNRCRTKLGSRLLHRWLRQPLLDSDEINKRLDIVQVFHNSTLYRNELRDGPLKAVPDLDLVLSKMHKSTAGLNEVFRLYVFVRTIPSFITILQNIIDQLTQAKEIQVLQEKFLTPLQNISGKFSMYEQLIEHVIDFQILPDLRINAQHDPDLLELATEQEVLLQRAEKVLSDCRNTWGSFTDVKLERSPQHGFILRATRGDDERTLRANYSSVRILSILKNGVHFTTSNLENISEKYLSLQSEYDEKQSELVTQAVETARTYLPVVEAIAAILAELDVLLSFATAAALSPGKYIRPTIHEKGSGILNLKSARHPCVELMDSMQQFIANDYDLVRGKSSFQIITGPNMGGKSTYIRGIGCIVVLAQIGMYVPCDSAEISMVDCILARVGAGDAVQKGISTFMAEMLESAVMLETATKDSLIIIDELGRGTSTFDGFGLAWSISDYIVQQLQCMCLFATHFHELTALSKQYPTIVTNKHVAAHIDTNQQVVMLYNLASGPCTQSFGIHVAKTADFPDIVIQEAKRKASMLETSESNNNNTELYSKDLDPSKLQKMNNDIEMFSSLDIQNMLPNTIVQEVKNIFMINNQVSMI